MRIRALWVNEEPLVDGFLWILDTPYDIRDHDEGMNESMNVLLKAYIKQICNCKTGQGTKGECVFSDQISQYPES